LVIEILAKVDWCHQNVKIYDKFQFMAYGKTTSDKWDHFFAEKTIASAVIVGQAKFNMGCFLLSALNEVPTKGNFGPPPFELVHDLVRKTVMPDFKYFQQVLYSLLTSMSREDLSDLARMQTKFPELLSDLPSLWEVFFHPTKGLAYTKRDQAKPILMYNDFYEGVFEGDFCSSDRYKSSAPSLIEVLERVRDFFQGEKEKNVVKNIMGNRYVMDEFARMARVLWLKDIKMGKDYVKSVIQVYIDTFEGELLSALINHVAPKISVQLLVVGEEQSRRNGDLKWSFENGFSLWGICYNFPKYNRECDWYRLIWEVPALRERVPSDFKQKTDTHLTWRCSLLRGWIQMFGEEERIRQMGRKGELIDCDYLSFWEKSAEKMKDGELLHIAVELGRLQLVKIAAWPRFIKWRNEKKKTSLDLSNSRWGKNHEITIFLQRETDNLVTSGFSPESKNEVTLKSSCRSSD